MNPKTQTSEASHTPTPWTFRKGKRDDEAFAVIECDTKFKGIKGTVARLPFLPDAAFVVRAVNAHEDLVSAAKVALKYMNHVKNWSTHGPASISSQQLADDLAQAIAKAEGVTA